MALVNSHFSGLSPQQQKSLVLTSVDKFARFEGKAVTQGRLNVANALNNGGIDQSLPLVPTSAPVQQASSVSASKDTSLLPVSGAAEESVQALGREPLELDIVTNHVMTRFTEDYRDLSKQERQALLIAYGVTIVKDYPYAGGSVLLEINGAPTAEAGKLPAGETKELVHQRVDMVIKHLILSGLVDYAEPDHVLQIAAVPNDPRYNELYGLQTIQAEAAWDYIDQNVANPTEIVVGVLDSGVDYTHPDLAAAMWVNPGEIPDDGIDNDGNGYVDDVHGWDAFDGDNDPMDVNGHGSHVAGTIAAVRDNNQVVVGVTPNVKIMALKFGGAISGSESAAIELINYVNVMQSQYGFDIRLTNNSWGNTFYSVSLEEAIMQSNTQNILVVAAAGNSSTNTDNFMYYPQGYDVPNVISVGATDSGDNLASFSNYGLSNVDIAAPGDLILSTVPDNAYAFYSGTSMAAPHVSGALALLASIDPTLNAAALKERVLNNADVVNGLTTQIAGGRRLSVNGIWFPG